MSVMDTMRETRRRLALLETAESIPVAARYTTNTGSVSSGGTAAIVNFATLVFDPWAAVATGASWAFTAPIGGYYLVSSRIAFAGTTGWALTELGYLGIYIGGALECYLDYVNDRNSGGSSIYTQMKGATVIDLAKDEALDIRCYQASGGALSFIAAHEQNYVSIARVG